MLSRDTQLHELRVPLASGKITRSGELSRTVQTAMIAITGTLRTLKVAFFDITQQESQKSLLHSLLSGTFLLMPRNLDDVALHEVRAASRRHSRCMAVRRHWQAQHCCHAR